MPYIRKNVPDYPEDFTRDLPDHIAFIVERTKRPDILLVHDSYHCLRFINSRPMASE